MTTRDDVRAGMASTLPMLVGIVPFGLVVGATPVARGLGGAAAVGFSTLVFAGASQLAAIDVLGDGGSALVAAVAACTINLRMLLYSASLAPYLAHETLARRLGAAYVLVDQDYAVSIARWSTGDVPPERRLPFYFGAALVLALGWQASTIVGVLVGARVPEEVPLDFAVPLVFLTLLIPGLTASHAVVAALAGGAAAVAALELGAGDLSILVGAVAGIVAGALVDHGPDR